MPIVDVQLVVPGTEGVTSGLAQAVADALGHLLASPPGRTWVRASTLPAANYAENGARLAPDDLPVFVTLLLAAPPEGEARVTQAARITTVVALAVGRDQSNVHIEYAAPGTGRMTFGGVLVQ
jgi:phenylpyruvate tautomerase PptA (4-oxalocrotonate tautomerase family)